MRFQQFAIVAGACPCASLPKKVELPASFASMMRGLGRGAGALGGEASAVLVHNPQRGAVEFQFECIEEGEHASPMVSRVTPPCTVVGTFHTHPESSTSATMADGRVVAPLAFSTSDVISMAVSMKMGKGLGERFSFLLCAPRTVYLLVWAKDSHGEITEMTEAFLSEALEEILDAEPDDEVEIDPADLPMYMQQAAPVMAIGRAAKTFNIGFYGGKLPEGDGEMMLYRFTSF